MVYHYRSEKPFVKVLREKINEQMEHIDSLQQIMVMYLGEILYLRRKVNQMYRYGTGQFTIGYFLDSFRQLEHSQSTEGAAG
jgi:hypothetical protein